MELDEQATEADRKLWASLQKTSTKNIVETVARTQGKAFGRAALLILARRLERKAAGLRSLAVALPEDLPDYAEETLWELVRDSA